MIAVIQRVLSAAVRVGDACVGKCEDGLLILLGVAQTDTEQDASLLAAKIAKLRIFPDGQDKMNRSVLDAGGGALVVSNFTLLANYKSGNRPDYLNAARPGRAQELYRYFVQRMQESGVPVSCGEFGAHMQIDLCADGPVTIVLDSALLKKQKATAAEGAPT